MSMRANLKTWRAMLLFLLGMWCASSGAVFAEDVSWIHGSVPPDGWSLHPGAPLSSDIIYFAGDIEEVYDNSCLAEQAQDGIPTLTINSNTKNIEIRFEPPAPGTCPNDFDPVCGLEGSFGPLEAGEWTFWIYYRVGPHGYVSFSSFQVGSAYHVDADASVGGTGTSWADAFKYLQDALDNVTSGDQIRVAQGTYVPDQNSTHPEGTGDRGATFELVNGVTIKGGYAGFGEPDPNARDVSAYETILSGDLNGDDGPNFINNGDNSYQVVTGSGTDETAGLDGFTITGGNAAGTTPSDKGGGMYNYQGSPTVTNCTFSSNAAGDRGGAMYNYQGSPTLTDCIFSNNRVVVSGGGMYNHAGNVKVTDCVFCDNRSNDDGGGMFNGGNSDVTLTGCSFTENIASDDGGGIANNSGDTTLNGCTMSGNTAGGDGGAVSNRSTLIITNSTISGSSAGRGGAIYNWECISTLTNCTFTANLAPLGNALAYGSIMGNHEVTNCILWDGGNEVWKNEALTITITYSDVEGGWPGEGNIDMDPYFADAGNGDCHLQSATGRWDPNQNIWVTDGNTSLCIDAGDPCSDWRAELWPHGKRINMGAYGGTPQASMSLSIAGNIADLTNSGVVDWKDLKLLVAKWLWQEVLLAEDLNKDGIVNFIDFAVFARELADTSAAEPNVTYQIDDCNQEAFELFALVSSGETRFTVTVEGPYIHFEDMMVANCCPDELALEMTVEDDLITIYETEYSPAPCWCICDYPVTATLGPFDPGTYTLEVYEDHSGFIGFIGSTIVSIGSTE